jgi:hypothetical protein
MKEINEKLLKKLAEIQCTDREIACCLEVSEKRLVKSYRDQIDGWRHAGKCSLRRAQWLKALSGDSVMLRHLGKVYLGQRDEITMTSEEPQVRKLLALWEKQPVDSARTDTSAKNSPEIAYEDDLYVNRTVSCKKTVDVRAETIG